MSLRQSRFMTTNASTPQATQFRDTLGLYYFMTIIWKFFDCISLDSFFKAPWWCWSTIHHPTLHRLLSTIVDRYNPFLGVPLMANLNLPTDCYDLGFWNNGPVSLLTFILYCVLILLFSVARINILSTFFSDTEMNIYHGGIRSNPESMLPDLYSCAIHCPSRLGCLTGNSSNASSRNLREWSGMVNVVDFLLVKKSTIFTIFLAVPDKRGQRRR